jgi:hypothetical protein
VSGLGGALCVGQGDLFESVELGDHVEAAALCHRCPAIAACRALLADERSSQRQFIGHGGGPVGTWAGELVGGKKYAARTKFDAWFERRYGVGA